MAYRKTHYNDFNLCKDIAESSLPLTEIAVKHDLSEAQVFKIACGDSRPELHAMIEKLSQGYYRETLRVLRSRGRAFAQRILQAAEGEIPVTKNGKKKYRSAKAETILRAAIKGIELAAGLTISGYDNSDGSTVIRTSLPINLQPKTNPVQPAPRARDDESESD